MQDRVADAGLVVERHAVIDAFLDGDLNHAVDDFLWGQVGAGQQVAMVLIELGDAVGGGAQAVKALFCAWQVRQQLQQLRIIENLIAA
ncbi:hypothetical protein D3C87_1978760 [compost metagenome]